MTSRCMWKWAKSFAELAMRAERLEYLGELGPRCVGCGGCKLTGCICRDDCICEEVPEVVDIVCSLCGLPPLEASDDKQIGLKQYCGLWEWAGRGIGHLVERT